MNDYAYFLSSLFEDGIVSVPEMNPLSEEELHTGNEILTEFEKQYRLEMPNGMPPFSLSVAEKSALSFYRACQFTVLRDIPTESIHSEFESLKIETNSPETHYSVDLVFRFLPDLFQLSKSAMKDDPLVKHLSDWAIQWPLSSIGIKNLKGPLNIEEFSKSPGLMRLYCDRIISTGDVSRLDDPRVKSLVESSWGMYPELAMNISKQLKNETNINNGKFNNG